MTKAAAFGPVGPLAPSWRVRVLLPRPALASAGIDLSPIPFFGEADAKAFASAGLAERAILIIRARRELGSKIERLDDATETVLIQRHVDMVPTLTWERNVARGRRVVFDIDDAIWLAAPRDAGAHRLAFLKGARRKVQFLARRADVVIAGNEFLAEWLETYSSRVMVIPSLVDPAGTPVREHHARPVVTWGWIGSRSTAQHLAAASATLARTAAELDAQTVRLLVLGAPEAPNIPGVDVEHRAWSEAAERDALEEIDIGLMPLPDNAWTRGKCAYKALLYMSAGIPVVADDVGVSRSTVAHGEGGLIARSEDDWVEALRLLSSGVEERRRLGRGARQRAEQHYSVARWGPALASALEGRGG